jgi:hypothetical protein
VAITELYSGTQAVDTTEHSMVNDASFVLDTNESTTDGVFQLWLDVSDMVTGDELQIRIYERVRSADTIRIAYQSNLVGPQSPPLWVSPSLILMHGWDMTLDAIAGTITVNWSIRQVA